MVVKKWDRSHKKIRGSEKVDGIHLKIIYNYIDDVSGSKGVDEVPQKGL